MKFTNATELKSKVIFSGMQTLSTAVRGGLNIYIITALGLVASGEVVSSFAIYVFIATFCTQLSGEILIRGFGERAGEDRYKYFFYALISDGILLLLSSVYIVFSYKSLGDDIDLLQVTFFCYLIAMCFSQIVFNIFLKIRGWKWLSFAAMLDIIILLIFGVVTFVEPTKEIYVLLAIAKPISLLICGLCFSLLSNRFNELTKNAKSHWGAFVLSVSIAFILRVFSLAHFVNLSTKTALSTLDVVLVQNLSGTEMTGLYKLVKSIAGIPSMVFGPVWTASRDRIQNDQLVFETAFDRGSTIIQVAGVGTSLLIITLPIIYYVASIAPESFILTSVFLRPDALYAFSCWYLQSSMFGWARYYNLYNNYMWSATFQNFYIIVMSIIFSFLVVNYTNTTVLYIIPTIFLSSNIILLYRFIRS